MLRVSQRAVFQVLAGILHLGQVDISEDRSGQPSIDTAPESSLRVAAQLFGVDVAALHKMLMTRRIVTRSEARDFPFSRVVYLPLHAPLAQRPQRVKLLYSNQQHAPLPALLFAPPCSSCANGLTRDDVAV